MELLTVARTNASLREEFLRRRLASEEALDRIGFVSHETLDEWEDQGSAVSNLKGLEEKAFGLGLLRGEEFNRRVIRGRGGRFGMGLGTRAEARTG